MPEDEPTVLATPCLPDQYLHPVEKFFPRHRKRGLGRALMVVAERTHATRKDRDLWTGSSPCATRKSTTSAWPIS